MINDAGKHRVNETGAGKPKDGFMASVIPGRREAAGPEAILRSAGVMDSGFATFGRAPE